MSDLADEDPFLAMLQEELDDDSSLADVEEDVVEQGQRPFFYIIL